MYFLFKTGIFHCYVCLPGCTWSSDPMNHPKWLNLKLFTSIHKKKHEFFIGASPSNGFTSSENTRDNSFLLDMFFAGFFCWNFLTMVNHHQTAIWDYLLDFFSRHRTCKWTKEEVESVQTSWRMHKRDQSVGFMENPTPTRWGPKHQLYSSLKLI